MSWSSPRHSLPFYPDAWPEGVRTLRCLRCDTAFASHGKAERLCPRCRSTLARTRVEERVAARPAPWRMRRRR